MNILTKILLWGKDFFFPSFCPLCESSFVSAVEIKYGLCDKCRASLLPIHGGKNAENYAACCGKCGKPLISEIDICLPCRNTERGYDRLWVLFPYIGKYRKLLKAYKFQKRLSLSNFFVEKIIEAIKENSMLADAVIVPVPPRRGKIKHTGWDQIDYLVKRLEKTKGCLPVSRCLKRRKSKAQKHLDRKERMDNLKGRIYLFKTAPKSVLIIDDVITTGSTMEACAKMLKENGAQKVYGLCLFYD